MLSSATVYLSRLDPVAWSLHGVARMSDSRLSAKYGLEVVQLIDYYCQGWLLVAIPSTSGEKT
jgi:hypothetical protein